MSEPLVPGSTFMVIAEGDGTMYSTVCRAVPTAYLFKAAAKVMTHLTSLLVRSGHPLDDVMGDVERCVVAEYRAAIRAGAMGSFRWRPDLDQ